MKDCPECGGYGHHGFEEDTGCPFTCYFCGATGKVTDEVAAEWEREHYVDPEYHRLSPIIAISYCDAGEPYERRRRILPWQVMKSRRHTPVADVYCEDIPF